MRLVEDAGKAWKWFSMHCMAAAVAVQGTWEMIPADLKASIPAQYVTYITLSLLVAGIFGRLVKQGDE